MADKLASLVIVTSLLFQYEKLIGQLDRLTEEPYAGEVEDFIMEYRVEIQRQSARTETPEVGLLIALLKSSLEAACEKICRHGQDGSIVFVP